MLRPARNAIRRETAALLRLVRSALLAGSAANAHAADAQHYFDEQKVRLAITATGYTPQPVDAGPPFVRIRFVLSFDIFHRGDTAWACIGAAEEYVKLGAAVLEPRPPRTVRNRSVAHNLRRIRTGLGVHRCCS